MTAPNQDDILQQYFDGELSAEDAAGVRRELAEDEELSQRLAGLERLGELMRVGAEEASEDLDSDALFSRIEAALEEDVVDDDPMFPTQKPPGLRVVRGGQKATPPAPPRRVWTGIVGGALAAAAAVALLLLIPSEPGHQVATGPDDGEEPVEIEPPPGSEIVEVDFGYNTGAIFAVEDPDEGARYAVVWISDEKVEDGLDAVPEPESEQRIQ